jgi:hypothetical protein
MRGFFEAARASDWERAAEYPDLRFLPAGERAERGPAMARELKGVLDRGRAGSLSIRARPDRHGVGARPRRRGARRGPGGTG